MPALTKPRAESSAFSVNSRTRPSASIRTRPYRRLSSTSASKIVALSPSIGVPDCERVEGCFAIRVSIQDEYRVRTEQRQSESQCPAGPKWLLFSRVSYCHSSVSGTYSSLNLVAEIPGAQDDRVDPFMCKLIKEVLKERSACHLGQSFRAVRHGAPQPSSKPPSQDDCIDICKDLQGHLLAPRRLVPTATA